MHSCTTPRTRSTACWIGSCRPAGIRGSAGSPTADSSAPGRDQRVPPSRQPVLGELRKAIPQLAANIVVVPPESELSTYALMSLCNSVIIYGTKTGVELTSRDPRHRGRGGMDPNKGLTCDASSPRWLRVLDGLPFSSRLDADMMARAPLRLPFLLQSHDSAALHRAARGKFHLPVEAEQRAPSSSRNPLDWIPSATAF